DRTEAGIAEVVARALANKGVTLGQLGRPEDAMAVYDEVVARFGDRTEAGIAEVVAGALHNRAVTLHQLGKYEQALADSNRSLRIRPAHPGTLFDRAILFAALLQPRRALPDVAEAVAAGLRAPVDDIALLLRSMIKGDPSLAAQVVDMLGPTTEPANLAPYQHALAYLKGGRDAYYLEALNPSIRRAVELVLQDAGELSVSKDAPNAP
ncbi:MAG TPA: tetratricopeptide repeat protein, partial [Chloroflexota bacterium]